MHTKVDAAHARRMEPIAVATSPEDIAYVRAHFAPLDELVHSPDERGLAGSQLPRATYQLPDGSAWYPRDWRRLLHDAAERADPRLRDGADLLRAAEHTSALFRRRIRAAAALLDHPCDPDEEWQAYLAGLYGACLREVTPETIVYKERLAARVTRMLAAPRPDDARWCGALRDDVEALDGLTRRFAACDRVRFGRPTSRDRLIDTPRRDYPQVFAPPAALPVAVHSPTTDRGEPVR